MFTDDVFDYIDSCKDESCIAEGLAIYLKSLGSVHREVERFFEGIKFKIDIVLNDNVAIEVKYQAMVYDGIGQALCYSYLLGYKESVLIHVYEYPTPGIIKSIEELSKRLPIKIILVSLRKREIYEF